MTHDEFCDKFGIDATYDEYTNEIKLKGKLFYFNTSQTSWSDAKILLNSFSQTFGTSSQ